MSKINGPLNEFDQHAAPRAFHFQNLVADTALDVIKLEETGRHRTSSLAPRLKARLPSV